MKAVAVYPGQANSVHLEDIPPPSLDQYPDGYGVLVKVLKVGVDATDREINEALYGNPPPGFKYLVLGHESFGIVEAVGPKVKSVKPGDYVTATVRRPGGSIYDLIGTYDMTSEETYYERGINLLHGFLTEKFVDSEEYIVKVPPGLKHLHVLMEPMSCAAKAVQQAYEAQRRMRVCARELHSYWALARSVCWRRCYSSCAVWKSTAVLGSKAPTRSSEIVHGLEANYVSVSGTSLEELAKRVGKADIIVDATGSSEISFGAMQYLGHNGALVWTSITGGQKNTTVPADKVNIEWVLGNKLLLGSVNANREYFESGIRDFAMSEMMYPGVIEKILTNPVNGLDNYAEMMRLLVEEKSALKVFVNVASE